MWRSSRTVASAPSRSALLTTNTSPISRMPAFAAWMPSPMPGREQHDGGVGQRRRPRPRSGRRRPSRRARRRSRRRRAPAAPAASAQERPPRWPREAIDRMKTPGSVACSCIRTRSPSSAPPENGDDGSTASTPTRQPAGAVVRDQRRGGRRLADARRAGEADDVRATGVAARARRSPRAATARRPRRRRSAARRRAADPSRARATRSATVEASLVASRAVGHWPTQAPTARGRSGRRPGRRRRTARPRRRRRRDA